MNVKVAQNAGFCFGVKRATDTLQNAMNQAKPGERIYTIGHLIHNEAYIHSLEEQGVYAIGEEDILKVASEATKDAPVTILIRAHGATKEIYETLKEGKSKSPYFQYLDCTCPFVNKIHLIAANAKKNEDVFLIMGMEKHPEVQGILSCFDGEKHVFAEPEELQNWLERFATDNSQSKKLILSAQTTYNLSNWYKSQEILKKWYTNIEIFDTICNITENRQKEADAMSKVCDFVLVVGGRESSNTAKLYEICKNNCKNTVWISSAKEPFLNALQGCNDIGIVAGASTPSSEIQEVYKTMVENESFEQMLESQCKTLNTGDVVTGIVTHVDDNELQLDVGAAVTGYIKAEQASKEPIKLTEQFHVGDKIDAFVIRVSDIEGMAELSKVRVDQDKNWFEIVKANEEKAVLEGTVAKAVKGGVEVYYKANRIFVPASQTGVAKDGDLTQIVGKTVGFKIIEIKNGKKAIGSIRVVEREIKKAAEKEFWSNIEVGKTYHGVVCNTIPLGAFVDLGGVVGMVHVTELSWKHIKNPTEVVKTGDEIDVFVKSFDEEKKRISLGYKTEETNPWNIFKSQYVVGDIVTVKISNMMPFGAFAEIIDGVDGLIHISQISTERIAKPADVLSIGQIVDARIIEINDEKKNVSLSIRCLIEEAQKAAEAGEIEETVEEATAEATDAQ